MGITVREMLSAEYFKDFRLLAGHKGLDKQIQGVAILDAPDGYNWTRGRELVISSGYVLKYNPKLFKEYMQSDIIKEISGLAIKVDRYLKEVPKDIIDSFNRYNIPFIYVPMEPSWMDIMNQLNVLVMNKNIKQFRIGHISPKSFSSLPYHSRKINKILSQIEKEMNFPAMLYDLSDEKPYYSSPVFVQLAADLKLEYFWNPPFDYTKEVLCDNLKIIRYRFIDEKYDKPYSWITTPITVDDNIKAYFVVVEATGLIDYFDQFALRTGFLLLQSLYEQMLVAKSIGDLGFEKFMTEIIEGNLQNNKDIIKRALDLDLDVNTNYYLLLMQQTNDNINISSYKDDLQSSFANSVGQLNGRMAIIDENSCIFFIPIDNRNLENENLELIEKSSKELKRRLQKKIDKIELTFGVSDIHCSITEIKRSYCRAKQAIKVGKLLYPNKNYLTYSNLGVFAWMHIEEDELEIMMKNIQVIIENDEDKELIKTLKVYLESNMNYSLTAKKLFIHINTVRKRIENINNLINFDLEDPTNRLKLEVLLKLMLNL